MLRTTCWDADSKLTAAIFRRVRTTAFVSSFGRALGVIGKRPLPLNMNVYKRGTGADANVDSSTVGLRCMRGKR